MEGTTARPELIHPALTGDLMDEIISYSIVSRMNFRMDSIDANDLVAAAMGEMIADSRKEAREGTLVPEDLVDAVATILEKTGVMYPEATVRQDVRTSCFLALCAGGLSTYECLLMISRGRGL